MWPFSKKEPVRDRVEPVLNASPENPSTTLANPADWLVSIMGGGPSIAGPVVNEQSAMRATTVFACVSLVSGLIASLPLVIYERGDKGRRVADDHPLWPLLHADPNDSMSGFTRKELISVDLLLGGNHYSPVEYNGAGRVTGLFPIPRNAVTPYRTPKGRLRYRVSLPDGVEEVDASDMVHIPGLGFDGIQGLSAISNARQAIGLSLAMEEGMARMHANGTRPSGVVSAEDGWGKDPKVALQRVRAQFEQAYSGLSNAGKTLFLDKGMKWSAMEITPADAETLAQRRFQIADICRVFGVPPFMVGETDKTTSWGSGLEQQTLGFLQFSLNRWLKRIEGELNRKLLPGARFYVEFDRDALLAMDATARAALFSNMVQNGGMTPNEVRRKQNLPDMDGGDQLFINSACVPLEKAGADKAAPAKAKKA